jgi:tetratricopeptide (TPR) repeat protein
LAAIGGTVEKEWSLKTAGPRLMIMAALACSLLMVVRYARYSLAEMHYFNGFKYSKQNALALAIPELEKAHALQRLEVNNNYELANCYARSGLKDKALDAYAESLRANAGYDEIYFNMATVLLQQGQREKAVAEYSRSLFINPTAIDAYTALGSIFLQFPEQYGAMGIKLFEQCLILYPYHKDMWNNLGYLYTRAGNGEEALKAYRRSWESDPDFEYAIRNMQIVLQQLKKHDTQFEEFQRLRASVERDVNARNWQGARASCERLVRLAPRSFNAHFYLANIYFSVGSIDAAIAQYREALGLVPNHTAALSNLAMAYLKAQQPEPARATLYALLQVDPNNAFAAQQLKQIDAAFSGRTQSR